MNIRKFAEDSPLGMGWIFDHVTLDEAVEALAELRGVPESAIRREYGIPNGS